MSVACQFRKPLLCVSEEEMVAAHRRYGCRFGRRGRRRILLVAACALATAAQHSPRQRPARSRCDQHRHQICRADRRAVCGRGRSRQRRAGRRPHGYAGSCRLPEKGPGAGQAGKPGGRGSGSQCEAAAGAGGALAAGIRSRGLSRAERISDQGSAGSAAAAA